MIMHNISFNIIYLFCMLVLLLGYVYLIVFFLKKSNEVVKLGTDKKEVEHNKYLCISLSKLTHELKNPIAVCNGYLEMLNLDDKEKSKKYVSIIKSEMNRSLSVINNFSAYGKLKKLDLEEIDLSYLLEDIFDTLSHLFEENDAYLDFDVVDDIYIMADYARLKQVFINLLKNTLEAKRENSVLRVRLFVKNLKDKIKIVIKDNGVGMDKNTLAHIYDLFYTTKQNGTGIGTNFSKEVIELHGGSIQYKSVINKGTEVIILLPKEKSPKTFSNNN